MARANVVRIPAFNPIADNLQAAIDMFTSTCRSKNLSARTVEYYGYRLRAFQRCLDGNADTTAPKDLSTRVIRDFFTYESENNSATTASHSYITLSAFFGFLVGDGVIEANPMENVDKPRRRKAVINTFTIEQVDSILSTCKKDFIGFRDRAMITMLLDCGLRASEVAGLSIEYINWTDQTLHVLGKGDKERFVPFGQVTRQALTAYLNRRGGT